MYCGHCGAELNPGDKMCTKCGYLVLDTQQSSGTQEVQSSVTTSEIVAPQEGVTSEKNIEPKEKFHSTTKFKLLLVIGMACFFFPFATVSCAGEDITASGYEIMTATSFADEAEITFTDFQLVDVKPNVYLVVSFLMGAIGIAFARKRKPLKLPCIFSASGAIFLILFRINFYSFYCVEEYRTLFSIKFRWGWIVAILFFIEATFVALNECINNPQIGKETRYIMQGLSYLLGGIILVVFIAGMWSFLTKPIYNPEMPRAAQKEVEDQDYFPDLQDPNGNSEAMVPEVSDYIIFDTEYYSLELPDYWADLCVYDQWDIEPYAYGIAFYEEQSMNDFDGDGGFLFSIALYNNEDYMDFPDYTYLGQLKIIRLANYDVVVSYPTDVQFSDAGRENYMKLSDDIPSILDSFTPQPDVDCEYIPAT